MPHKSNMQLEAHIDHALRRHVFHPLEDFLQKEYSSQKCSKDMLLKIDKLICRELEQNKIQNVSLILNVIYKFAKIPTPHGDEYLVTLIKQGLVEKMVTWFAKIREILKCTEILKNKALITLSEDFFDVVMAVHDKNAEGRMQILEKFISRTCSLVSDGTINIFIRREAVHKLNLMLDTVPREMRKKIISTTEMSSYMSSMGKRILDAGDYDLQVAITEALCRMNSEAQREELASQWFPMEFITNSFKEVKDSDFETDCRKFLNLVNGILGDKRRVFTYPCISAHLDNHKLHIPTDEKLEEFWIDFNVGTQSISFYVSTDIASEELQWETVFMAESEVNMYNIEEKCNQTLLSVSLNTPVAVGQKSGSQIHIYFDSTLDISSVAKKVFGTKKFKDFIKKKSISVAKTAVHIIFDESGSQIIVPESQGSVSSSKNETLISNSDINMNKQPPLSIQSHNMKTFLDESAQRRIKVGTPSRSKVSEASISIHTSSCFKAVTPSALTHEQEEVVPETQFSYVKDSPLKSSNSTCQNEKASEPNECIYNNDKNYIGGDDVKQQTCHRIFKNEKCTERTKSIANSIQKILQPQEIKTANQENDITTGGNKKNNKRKTFRSSLKAERTLKKSFKISKISLHNAVAAGESKKDCEKNEAARLKKCFDTWDAAKLKDAEKQMDEKTISLPDVAQSKEFLKRKKEVVTVRKKMKNCTVQTKKEKVQNKKCESKGNKELSTVKHGELGEDVYSFHSIEYDDPTIEFGISTLVLSKGMVNTALSKTEILSEKYRSKMESKQKIKDTSKHFFCDTDIERGDYDSKTDISWLHEPGSKRKLNIFSYSRKKQGKYSGDTLPCKAAAISKQDQKKSAKSCKEQSDEYQEKGTQRKIRRSNRATTSRKNYREDSNSESEFEEESTQHCRTVTHKSKDELYVIKKTLPVEKETEQINQGCKEHVKSPTKTEDNVKTVKTKPTCKEYLVSPGSIEQIRSEQYESDIELTSRNEHIADFSSPCASSLQLTPDKLLNISAAIKKGNTEQLLSNDKSQHKGNNKRDTGQEALYPVPSHLSLALDLDHSTVSGINILEIPEEDYNKYPLRTFSITDTTRIQAHEKKKDTSGTSLCSKTSLKRTSCNEITCFKLHESGPTLNDTMTYLKHLNDRGELKDPNAEENTHELKQKKMKLLPRRLFASTDKKKSGVSESLSTVSGNDLTTEDIDTWDQNDFDINMICQKMSKEFARKVQNRSKKMDCFTKQSLKSAQKHITSMDCQVKQCRITHLGRFQQTLLEEVENFEKDSQALKEMEKESTNFWNQQTQVLSFYHKNEKQRIQCLQASFKKNVSNSIDYEDKILKSEIHIMKEQMKTVQERLLKEMQEEELLSVRRGLQSLFMTGASPF